MTTLVIIVAVLLVLGAALLWLFGKRTPFAIVIGLLAVLGAVASFLCGRRSGQADAQRDTNRRIDANRDREAADAKARETKAVEAARVEAERKKQQDAVVWVNGLGRKP